MSAKVLILNGPNLNLLGTREPEIYGSQSLSDIEADCRKHGTTLGLDIDFRQSNGEGELVDWVQQCRTDTDALIVNAGAYSHTSVALLDALLAIGKPVVEVHLSNLFKRDEFRHHSYVTQASVGLISGFGAFGYRMALDAVANLLNKDR